MNKAMQPGKTVRLKAGGPVMTVESVATVGGKAMIHCVWFDHDHNERRGAYPETELVEAVAGPSKA